MLKKNSLITIFLILVCSCSKIATPIVTKYKQFIVSEENSNITLNSNSNKIIAIIHNTLLDSQSVFGSTSKIISKAQAKWEVEQGKTHELFRITPQQCKYIYVSTINSVSERIIKQKMDALDKNIFKIIIVKVDADIKNSKVCSFIHNVGKANLKIAFMHTDINKYNSGNLLYWDGNNIGY